MSLLPLNRLQYSTIEEQGPGARRNPANAVLVAAVATVVATVGVASYNLGAAHTANSLQLFTPVQTVSTAARPVASLPLRQTVGRSAVGTSAPLAASGSGAYAPEAVALPQATSQINSGVWSIVGFGSVITAALLFVWNRMQGKQTVAMAATTANKEGFEMQREGVKKAAADTILTPRFYTTDFDECAQIFSKEFNEHLDMKELEAVRDEFVKDYNQNHFVRNDNFKAAASWVDGDSRKIFVEFLERSCTAEFSGFLLYKELGRRLKEINPVVADIFTLMSRDEARHAGFLNKTMSDFDLALDLGFLTKHREYTFFKPKFIFYATYLSEKIGYWRYITIYRHLQKNPEQQFSPLFQYFENWCQDENRHGDFFSAILKTQPKMLQGWDSKLWCRFFCHSVYITMYLNDHQRSAFYEQCGLNTTEFNQHVIRETNNTTARIFPAVPNVNAPDYFPKMDQLVVLNNKLAEIGANGSPAALQNVQKAPIIAQMVGIMLDLMWATPIECGTLDREETPKLEYV
jgi:magnesium-protoporphyrin IX monomethyl ester (oxidative) cyclase|eukprot:CAMPEP_0174285028 /NCGR_PEP_ID=MMETSP0809-20121228/7477_1 /TAXON_ID=73025 ORGANISM="Eutreptiella gymnastica-like, Strain CCMP1594" /NCGR_SAMPLE_ID=MMETSP0809 /ASSEMBLY_ACC=CAM_ASM_000658 /LENGTH=517 /DNA_ID=CAMNT_0015380705 /DNA_START=19 /DNA_END=1572 /DNA_ORIENTATION=-